MGDMADMMIDGLLDSETGELIDGDAPGFPRTMYGNIPGAQPARQKLPNKPHKCGKCGKRFKKLCGLEAHTRDVHSE